MKIAMVTQSYYPQVGGVTEHVHYLSKALRSRGHRVVIVTGGRGQEDDGGIVRIGRNAVFPINGAFVNVTLGIGLRRRLRRVLAAGGFDVIHVHCPMEPTLPLAAVMALMDLQIPVVGTFHMCARVSPAYEVFSGLMQKYALRLDARIAVSKAARGFAQKYFPGYYHLIPNGVEFQRFAYCEGGVPGLKDGKVNLLFVGRFDVRKNVPWLISAFRHLRREKPHCRLILVGTGFMKPLCRLLACGGRGDGITFTGRIPPGDLPSYYAAADIFCSLPSGSESFGIVLLEAMAAGKPVVGTDIEGYREVIRHGVDGILVRPGDTQALAQGLGQLLADHKRRRQLGREGQRKAKQFDWARIAESIEDIYCAVSGASKVERSHEYCRGKAIGLP